MTNKREKIQDKLQFIGLLGPVILLLTLFCTLIKGSPKSGYLFFITLFSLPALWQWRWKGFWGSMGSLALFLGVFMPFVSSGERTWQIGAAVSLALGLYISFMGFEEIRSYLEKLKLESQSRLDNLISLDEKFNFSQLAWKKEKSEFNQQLHELQSRNQRYSEEVHTLEKLTSTLKEELSKEQNNQRLLLKDIEEKQAQISKYESEVLKTRDAYDKIDLTLKEDRTEREKRALQEVETLKKKLNTKEQDSGHLQSQIQTLSQEKDELEQRAIMKDDAFKSMQEALREKVSSIHELHEKLQIKEQDLKNQKNEVDQLMGTIHQKEHENLTLKDAIKERDLQLQGLNQKYRDVKQDLETARAFLDAKKKELSELMSQTESEGYEMQEKIHQKDEEVKRQIEYIQQLENESQVQVEKIKSLVEETESLARQMEQQKADFESLQEKESALKEKQFQELRKLNDARVALYQSSLDKERLKENSRTLDSASNRPKHWLYQLELLLKGEPSKKINFSNLPRDLSEEILTLHQTKSLYKQLRAQFDEKSEILEETRKELFQTQTDCTEIKKKVDEALDSQQEPEKELHKNLQEQINELASMEKEAASLYEIISKLMEAEKEAPKSS